MTKSTLIAVVLITATAIAQDDGLAKQFDRLIAQAIEGNEAAADELLRYGEEGGLYIKSYLKKTPSPILEALVKRFESILLLDTLSFSPSRGLANAPTGTELYTVIIDSPQELQIIHNIEGPPQPQEMELPITSQGGTIILFITPLHYSSVGNIIAKKDLIDGFIDFEVNLHKQKPLGRGWSGAISRTQMFLRNGMGIRVKYTLLDEDASPIRSGWSLITGGRGSADRISQQLTDKLIKNNDILEIKRLLKKRRKYDTAELALVQKVFEVCDPITGYWAARVLAANERDDILINAVKSAKTRWLNDYFISAIYQAIIDTNNNYARGVVLNPHLFYDVLQPNVSGERKPYSETSDRARWLVPMIAATVTEAEEARLLNILSNPTMTNDSDSILFAVDMLLEQGSVKDLEAVFKLRDVVGEAMREEVDARLIGHIGRAYQNESRDQWLREKSEHLTKWWLEEGKIEWDKDRNLFYKYPGDIDMK